MDKELSLILKLVDSPSNASEASRLLENLEKQKTSLRDVNQMLEANALRRQELLRKEAVLVEEATRLEKEAARARRESETLRSPEFRNSAFGQTSSKAAARADDRAADLEKKVSELRASLGGVREEISNISDEYAELDDTQAKVLNNGVRAYEKLRSEMDKATREVERHTLAKGKAYQKLFQHIAGGFQSTVSLAKSAALAYASAMDTDDETVKKWLQWFAAIESVSQAITGVYGTYRALRGIMEALNMLRVKDIALAQAQAKAEALVCAAKQCGVGGGDVPTGAGKGAGGLWGRAKSMAGRVGGAIGRFAMSAGGQLLGAAAAGIALGEVYNYASSGETLTGAIGGAWSARSSEQASRRRAEEMERLRPLRNQVQESLYNAEYNSRENVAGRLTRSAESGSEAANSIAGMGWTSTANRIRVTQAQYDASEQAARRLRSGAESMETMEGGREQAAEMRKRAAEQELQAVQQLIELKRLQQQLDMEAAQRDVNAAKTRQQMAEAESEFYKAIVDDVKREREQVTGRMAGAKGGEIRRGFSAREKAEAGGDLTYREAMAMKSMGLDTNEKLRQAVQSAMEREVVRKGGPQAAEYYERLRQEQEAAQQGSDLYGAEARGAKADVKIAQSIVVELKKEQDNELEALMESLEPSLRKLLAERNEQLEKAIEEGIRNGVLQTVLKMSEEELTQNVLKGGSQ